MLSNIKSSNPAESLQRPEVTTAAHLLSQAVKNNPETCLVSIPDVLYVCCNLVVVADEDAANAVQSILDLVAGLIDSSRSFPNNAAHPNKLDELGDMCSFFVGCIKNCSHGKHVIRNLFKLSKEQVKI